jgi:hypothetical protein
MPWFLTDDQFHSHPKARRAGLAAIGLWNVSGAWSQAHKQEGFVPDWFVASWPQGKRLADRLVVSGLWLTATKGDEAGWQFHDWLDIHPTADEIEKKREKDRERQRRRRAGLRGEKGDNS